MVSPKLECSGVLVSLKYLKDVKAEVTTINNASVRNTKEYKDLDISYEKSIVLPYLVAPKTVSIIIHLSG